MHRPTGIRTSLLLAWALSAPASALAQTPRFDPNAGGSGGATDIRPQDVVQWQPFEAREVDEGQVSVSVRMTVRDDWKVYATNLSFAGPTGFTVVSVTPPPSHKFMDPIENKEVDVYDGGEFTILLGGTGRWQGATFPLAARYVGCTNVICLFPYTESMEVPFTPLAATAADQSAEPTAAAPVDESLEARLARAVTGGKAAFGTLLFFVFLGGVLSNLTPCVAPMVPITLRLLARQGTSPYLSASCYALGIVVTYSSLGLVASLSGGLFGSMLASKAFNVTFAIIMVALGVSMLGFGDFSRLQALGSRLGSGKPSPFNTFLMGAGAGFVAAPCTGPILAALLAYTTKNNVGPLESTALLGTYSVGFAAPYVALGGAAAKISSVRVSHHLQIAVKLLFAAVMFGLGLYYLRVPFYGLIQDLRGHWQPIALGATSLGAMLTGLWVVVPDLQTRKGTTIVPALVLGTGLFAASQWATSTTEPTTLVHLKSEADAFAAAKATGKPILIDMWAEWCEACKKMDVTTFVDPVVVRTLTEGWVTLKLDLTEDNDVNTEILTRYELTGLPSLILLPPSGELKQMTKLTSYQSAEALLGQLQEFRRKQAE